MKAETTDEDGGSRFAEAYLTNEQWQEIKASLNKVGVNADTVRVKTGLGKQWLRDGLPIIAQGRDINSRLRKAFATPKQLAAEQNHTIELCKTLLARLDDPCNYNRVDPDTGWLQFSGFADLAAHTRADLSALIAKLEHCRDELMAMGTSQGKHFQKVHVQFWKELDRVWHENVRVRWTAKDQTKFLVACSMPFFPEDTTYGAINAFIERGTASSK
jgi:hypothetical protein